MNSMQVEIVSWLKDICIVVILISLPLTLVTFMIFALIDHAIGRAVFKRKDENNE